MPTDYASAEELLARVAEEMTLFHRPSRIKYVDAVLSHACISSATQEDFDLQTGWMMNRGDLFKKIHNGREIFWFRLHEPITMLSGTLPYLEFTPPDAGKSSLIEKFVYYVPDLAEPDKVQVRQRPPFMMRYQNLSAEMILG